MRPYQAQRGGRPLGNIGILEMPLKAKKPLPVGCHRDMAEGVFDTSFDDSVSTASNQYQIENISNRRVCQSSAFRADIVVK